MSRAQLRSRIKLAFEVVLVPDHLGGDDNRVDGDPDQITYVDGDPDLDHTLKQKDRSTQVRSLR
jgi:hypothetical protein